MTTVKNIYDYINSIAPFSSQEEWDNSGFLIGDFRKEVKRVVLSLDGTKKACDYAASINADLLITHHPIIFNGVKAIEKGASIYTLIENDIAVISSHTPFDKSEYGINYNLADLLGLTNTYKNDNEFVVYGELENEMSIDDFAEFVCNKLSSNGLRYTDTDKMIKKVAVAGGACEEFIAEAMNEADCFVTGDLKYHDMLDASENGWSVISAGHFETESEPFLKIKELLEKIFIDVEFVIAPVNNSVLGL